MNILLTTLKGMNFLTNLRKILLFQYLLDVSLSNSQKKLTDMESSQYKKLSRELNNFGIDAHKDGGISIEKRIKNVSRRPKVYNYKNEFKRGQKNCSKSISIVKHRINRTKSSNTENITIGKYKTAKRSTCLEDFEGHYHFIEKSTYKQINDSTNEKYTDAKKRFKTKKISSVASQSKDKMSLQRHNSVKTDKNGISGINNLQKNFKIYLKQQSRTRSISELDRKQYAYKYLDEFESLLDDGSEDINTSEDSYAGKNIFPSKYFGIKKKSSESINNKPVAIDVSIDKCKEHQNSCKVHSENEIYQSIVQCYEMNNGLKMYDFQEDSNKCLQNQNLPVEYVHNENDSSISDTSGSSMNQKFLNENHDQFDNELTKFSSNVEKKIACTTYAKKIEVQKDALVEPEQAKRDKIIISLKVNKIEQVDKQEIENQNVTNPNVVDIFENIVREVNHSKMTSEFDTSNQYPLEETMLFDSDTIGAGVCINTAKDINKRRLIIKHDHNYNLTSKKIIIKKNRTSAAIFKRRQEKKLKKNK